MMRGDEIYRISGGIVLILFSAAILMIKFWGAPDIPRALSEQPTLILGCLAIAGLGCAVTVAGSRRLGKIRRTTELILAAVRDGNHVITVDIAATTGLHEVDIRERVDEMIQRREIPTGTRITYNGGENVVGQPKK